MTQQDFDHPIVLLLGYPGESPRPVREDGDVHQKQSGIGDHGSDVALRVFAVQGHHFEHRRAHDPEIDGDWELRKSAARQAYSEWMPIRGDALQIYRAIRFGKMAELILLDLLNQIFQSIWLFGRCFFHTGWRSFSGQQYFFSR